MPNPAIIHHQSMKLEHSLGVASVFIQLKQPQIFEVEPTISDEYRPDAYTRIEGTPVLVEYQRTRIAKKKMENKIQEFANTYIRRLHDAKTLLIVTDYPYDVSAPAGFTIVQKRMDAL